jgi:hypothetical protein
VWYILTLMETSNETSNETSKETSNETSKETSNETSKETSKETSEVITKYIDMCIFNSSHYDIANVVYKYLKDKHRYVENNTWEYFKTNADTEGPEGTWEIDINNKQLIYSIRTTVCSAFTDRSLYWADVKNSDVYPDTEIISIKLLNISSKLKDNKYICVLIKECKQFFV